MLIIYPKKRSVVINVILVMFGRNQSLQLYFTKGTILPSRTNHTSPWLSRICYKVFSLIQSNIPIASEGGGYGYSGSWSAFQNRQTIWIAWDSEQACTWPSVDNTHKQMRNQRGRRWQVMHFKWYPDQCCNQDACMYVEKVESISSGSDILIF